MTLQPVGNRPRLGFQTEGIARGCSVCLGTHSSFQTIVFLAGLPLKRVGGTDIALVPRLLGCGLAQITDRPPKTGAACELAGVGHILPQDGRKFLARRVRIAEARCAMRSRNASKMLLAAVAESSDGELG